jgi:maltose-binding protein MalE
MKLWRPRNRIIGNALTLFYQKTVIKCLPSAAAEFLFAIKKHAKKNLIFSAIIKLN